jgi:hypothetical protein
MHSLGDLIQRLDHAGFIVDLLHANQPRQRAILRRHTPKRIHRQPLRIPAWRKAASCSTGEIAAKGCTQRCMAMASASLAPLVKITSPCQPSAALTRSRASSSAARAARPARCGLDGLAQSANPSSMAERATGNKGVVAA